MRLIRVSDFTLHWFEDEQAPPYAILSHVWGPDEVLFGDIKNGTFRERAGFAKLASFCRQAAEDGYEYGWDDTCCIDKSDSAELSEAINSMFRWYQNSDVCYAYLEDVNVTHDHDDPDGTFQRSRWFTRGWTLQELIAPQFVWFYTASWAEIGSRLGLKDAIATTTKIHATLFEEGRLSEFSFAQQLSWAAGRQTTRPEDRAYSLLGLFGVAMPPIYGEGAVKAFKRMQAELLKNGAHWGDDSILAHAGHEVLACSPDDYKDSGSIERGFGYGRIWNTSRGVELRTRVLKTESMNPARRTQLFTADPRLQPDQLAILSCRLHHGASPVAISLWKDENNIFFKAGSIVSGGRALVALDSSDIDGAAEQHIVLDTSEEWDPSTDWKRSSGRPPRNIVVDFSCSGEFKLAGFWPRQCDKDHWKLGSTTATYKSPEAHGEGYQTPSSVTFKFRATQDAAGYAFQITLDPTPSRLKTRVLLNADASDEIALSSEIIARQKAPEIFIKSFPDTIAGIQSLGSGQCQVTVATRRIREGFKVAIKVAPNDDQTGFKPTQPSLDTYEVPMSLGFIG
ncbi:hypothetical protein MAPG_10052 [Magnaporthiopsis poae ATCC 64411]|uniref:Heterokaryon incompatibility domain-containing protein n=1 Tax=Magnaporthiopsis poae (strain ATCC 64411 / 73-15) TaxID=644358 RepID=A0A0C4EBK1_MAGP6|nr:hypothetical protein MAPG_10052 [Magnaporthiopsis poae ATCC 64411]